MLELFRVLNLKEAAATTAMSHPFGCKCDSCLATQGDTEAMLRLISKYIANENNLHS
jgi:hypothetical protein